MLKLAVFRRSNWSVEGLEEAQKNAAIGPKSESLTKMVQQLRHSHIFACVVSEPPPNISQGYRRPRGKPYFWRNVKIAIPLAGKAQAKMSVVNCIVLRAVLTYQIQ
jgi:hypothetical protein